MDELEGMQESESVLNMKLFLREIIEKATIPTTNRLLPNYPNPFNPETRIPFQLSKDADVVIRVYDVSGRLVRKLDLGSADSAHRK